jgi:putative Holliday junction resolvase
MGRILALDVGEKTIGVALSDETQTFVFPGKTLPRPEGYRKAVAAIAVLIADHAVERVVVGIPLCEDGSIGPQAEKMLLFVEALRKRIEQPVEVQDERLTTWEAAGLLREAGAPRERQKKRIDSAAAAIILQDYLNRRRREEEQRA